MKKTLLTLLAIAAFCGVSRANEHKIVFDSGSEVHGYPCQEWTNIKSADGLTFVQDMSFTEEGIDFSIRNTADTGYGLAIVNGPDEFKGLLIFAAAMPGPVDTKMTPEITLTVPNGNITGVKLCMYGQNAMSTLEIPFNGEMIEPEIVTPNYYWNWTSEEGAETVTFGWTNQWYVRVIRSIEVIYTEDLGGKKESGLSFNEKSVEVVMGEEYTLPELSNPNNLEITWSSSDEKVATIDDKGNVTLIGGGKTSITASGAATEEVAAGKVMYELVVIPTASSLPEFLAVAPAVYDRVKVTCDLRVMYGHGAYAYVLDPDDNAGCIEDTRYYDSTSTGGSMTTVYNAGAIIPAGWIATNATMYETVIWQGLPADSDEKFEVEYPVVESVSPADVNRVVIMKNLVFTTSTPSDNTKAYGTAPDGTVYEFQDSFDIGSYPPGTYDVTFVVRYSKRGETVYYFMSPIAFEEAEGVSVDMTITDAEESVHYYNLNGVEVLNPESGLFIEMKNGKAAKVIR